MIALLTVLLRARPWRGAALGVLVAIAGLLIAGRAAAFTPPPSDGFVTDVASKLSPAERASLNAKLQQYQQQTGNQLVVLIAGPLGDDTIEDAAYATFNAWKIGQRGKDNGALLVIAPAERKVRIETGKGVGGQLTDLQSNDILRTNVSPHLKQNDFFAAVDDGTTAIASALGGSAPRANTRAVDRPRGPAPQSRSSPAGSCVGLGVLIGFVLLLSFLTRGRRGFFIFPGGGGWGGGGGDGGGWGGGGGGDGGGFSGGGGESGGGGSSDSYLPATVRGSARAGGSRGLTGPVHPTSICGAMGGRILVIDDSPTLRRVVAAILQRAGFETVCAPDGPQALDLLRSPERERIELLLLDFVMPRMTGFEFCRRLRADESLRDLPVVLMSAKAERIRDKFIEQTGALDAVTKPFDPRALIAVVEASLQKAEQRRSALRAAAAAPPPPTDGAQPEERSLDATLVEGSPVSPEPGWPGAAAVAAALADLVAPALSAAGAPGSVTRDSLRRELERSLTVEALRPLAARLEREGGLDEVLRGQADAVPLAEVLQILQIQLQTGVLSVRRGEAEINILFRQGLVNLAGARGGLEEFRLGRYLVEERLVSRADLEEAAAESKAAGQLLGDTLVERGRITRDDLQAALVRQASELIYEVLRWRDARYSFRLLAEEPRGAGAQLGLPVASLVMEGFRRVDEWRVIEEHINFESVLLRNPPAIDALGVERLGRVERAILDAVDGERSVREVVRMSSASSFDACKILYQFLQSRLVRARAA